MHTHSAVCVLHPSHYHGCTHINFVVCYFGDRYTYIPWYSIHVAVYCLHRAATHKLHYTNYKMLIGCAFTRIHFEFRKAAGNKLEG